MTRKVFVAGVGMIPFKKPGTSDSYDVMGAQAVRAALADAGIGLRRRAAGLRRLCLRRLHLRPEGALPRRHDRHPGHQRQQQLLDRLVRAVPRAAGGAERRRRLRARGRLRADAAGRADAQWDDRRARARTRSNVVDELVGRPDVPSAIRQFGGAGRAHMQKYGTKLETFAKIRAKASRHAAQQPARGVPQGRVDRGRDGRRR